jgi:hypothetical protein
MVGFSAVQVQRDGQNASSGLPAAGMVPIDRSPPDNRRNGSHQHRQPTQSVEMSGSRTTLVDLLVSLNNSHAGSDPATGSPPITDAADIGDSDADLPPASEQHH